MGVIDITGQRFGRLVVVERGPNMGKAAAFRCLCDCGRAADIRGDVLRKGKAVSCGCYRSERLRTHGRSRTKTYCAWSGVIERCENPNDPAYPSYGGRGIRVCARWRRSFEAFLADMGEAPPGLTLERNNVNGDYEPNNCRWATRAEQTRNRRNNIIVVYNGQKMCLAELSKLLGYPREAVHGWILAGLPLPSPRKRVA